MITRDKSLALIACAILSGWLISLSPGQGDSHAVPVGIIVVASESEAAQVAAQLKSGADFGALARSKSTDPTANDSGYMGMLDPAKLRPELRDALQGIGRGQISGIAKIPSGYAILKVLNEPPAGKPSVGDTGRTQALGGQSAILPTPDFVGYAEANLAFSRFPKPAGWEDDISEGCAARTQSVTDFTTQFEAYLKGPNADPKTLAEVNSIVANLHSFHGEMAETIAFRETALQIAQKTAPTQGSIADRRARRRVSASRGYDALR